MPRGILIPWETKGQLWCLRVRSLPGADFRYRTIKGSSNGLYGADAVRYQQPVVLTEGEIDALTIRQSCHVAAVATGSTTGSRTPLWTGLLARASAVLVAYDDDEAGNTHAQYWLSILSQAKRWHPPWGDVNDLATAGVDIAAWIADGLGVEGRSAICQVSEAEVARETVQDTRQASTYEEFMAIVKRIRWLHCEPDLLALWSVDDREEAEKERVKVAREDFLSDNRRKYVLGPSTERRCKCQNSQ